MKKYLKILLVATSIGVILAYLFYKDIKDEVKAITNKEEVLTLFQVGVFKNYNNALEYSTNYSNTYIYYDNEYYRVIINALHNKDVIKKEEDIYKKKNITYYLKEIRVKKELIERLDKYEEVIRKTNKEEVIDKINKSILDIFKEYF